MSTSEPATVQELVEELHRLGGSRGEREEGGQAAKRARSRLNKSDREAILAKTGGRCHVCGGDCQDSWQADHVLAHSGGGEHSLDNYLPAHRLCNNYRWNYRPEEFQYILKLGVWARTQIARETSVGAEMAARFVKYEAARRSRRRT